VICDLHPINEERGDRIATHPAGGRGVEKLGVFVPFQRIADLGPSFPVHGLFLDSEMESVQSEGT
jgi:hypothetical protein